MDAALSEVLWRVTAWEDLVLSTFQPHRDSPAPSLRGRRPWQSRAVAKVGVITDEQAVLDCFAALAMTEDGAMRRCRWSIATAIAPFARFTPRFSATSLSGGNTRTAEQQKRALGQVKRGNRRSIAIQAWH